MVRPLKDTIAFGVLAGIIANIPKTILAWAFHFAGVLRYTFAHIAAGYFVGAEMLDNPIALATGFVADYTLAAVLGIILYLIIQKTGTDYAILKGIVLGSFMYLIFYGALMALDITRASLLTPLPNLLLFFPHVIFGASAGWIIKRYSGIRAE